MLTVTQYKKEELGDNRALFLNSNFMQTVEWAELKGEYGFNPLFFILEDNDKQFKEGLVVLVRPLFKGFKFAYIPHGPSEKCTKIVNLSDLSVKLKEFMPKGTLFIRYDLLNSKTDDNRNLLKGLNKSSVDVQVPDTTILDISLDNDTLLANMHKKTRYNIRLARKKGVVVREADKLEIDKWYDMYQVTAKRDSIAIHSREYYKSVYDKVNCKLMFAEHDGDLLAGIFVVVEGNLATYLYGASDNIKRNLMPSYILQWESILLSKRLGATNYDFFGIPPAEDPNHPMHGLYRFKVGFGGKIVHRVGCYDFSLSILTSLFKIAERLRNFYYKKIKK